jgi:hypothetical protein
MINIDALRESVCKTFCGEISVKALPSGIAITTMFRDAASDSVACFIEQENGEWHMADDGHFLPDIIARGIDIEKGARKEFLDRVLGPVGAWCDLRTLEIRTRSQRTPPPPEEILQFITALVRARDVTFWSRERVKSTFKEDAYQALVERFARLDIARSVPVDGSLREFPADVVLRPRKDSDALRPATAVFLVQMLDAMNEALMLWMELREQRRSDVRVTALVEDGTINLSSDKAQRALNRIDATAFFRGDEKARAGSD